MLCVHGIDFCKKEASTQKINCLEQTKILHCRGSKPYITPHMFSIERFRFVTCRNLFTFIAPPSFHLESSTSVTLTWFLFSFSKFQCFWLKEIFWHWHKGINTRIKRFNVYWNGTHVQQGGVDFLLKFPLTLAVNRSQCACINNRFVKRIFGF